MDYVDIDVEAASSFSAQGSSVLNQSRQVNVNSLPRRTANFLSTYLKRTLRLGTQLLSGSSAVGILGVYKDHQSDHTQARISSNLKAEDVDAVGHNAGADNSAFTGNDGQSIILAFSHPCYRAYAVRMQISRPSKAWTNKCYPYEPYVRPKILFKDCMDVERLARVYDEEKALKRFRTHRSSAKGESNRMIWEHIRDQWKALNPWPLRITPFLRVTVVEEATGRLQKQGGDRFAVTIFPVSRDKTLRNAREYIKYCKKKLSEDSRRDCKGSYDENYKWEYRCAAFCHSLREHFTHAICYAKELEDAKLRQARIEDLDQNNTFMRCFSNPGETFSGDTLRGMTQDSFIYDNSDLDDHLQETPYSKVVRALHIKTTWQIKPHESWALAFTFSSGLISICANLITGQAHVMLAICSALLGFVPIFLTLSVLSQPKHKVPLKSSIA